MSVWHWNTYLIQRGSVMHANLYYAQKSLRERPRSLGIQLKKYIEVVTGPYTVSRSPFVVILWHRQERHPLETPTLPFREVDIGTPIHAVLVGDFPNHAACVFSHRC